MTFNHQTSTGPAAIDPLTGKICQHRSVLVYDAEIVSGFLPEGWSIVGSTRGPRSNVTALMDIRREDRTILSLEAEASGMQVKRMVAQLEQKHVDMILGILGKALDQHLELKADRNLPPAPEGLLSEIDGLGAEAPAAAKKGEVCVAMVGTPQSVLRDAFTYGPGDLDGAKRNMDDGELLPVSWTAG